jgi:hypothetical protein
MPPPTLLLRRMEVQVLSLLGEFRAGADWGAITAEYHAGRQHDVARGRPCGRTANGNNEFCTARRAFGLLSPGASAAQPDEPGRTPGSSTACPADRPCSAARE